MARIRVWILPLLLSAFLAGPAGGQQVQVGVSLETLPLLQVLDQIDKEYVDPVGLDTLVEQSIVSLLQGLDPYSNYIPAREAQRTNEELMGRFYGIGIQYWLYQDTARVMSVIRGTPAHRGGLLSEDRILAVDGKSVVGASNFHTINGAIRGAKGTPVRLTILRQADTLRFRLLRDSIPLRSVDASYMVNRELGYVSFTNFSATTCQELSSALDSLKRCGMRALILDLRGNPGGIMESAVNVAALFLPKSTLVVYSKGRAWPRQEYTANVNGSYSKLPMAVLIDAFSASSSEIVAGALQDNDRAVIVGQQSSGKGLVQQQMGLYNGALLRLTKARYFTPSGRCIQRHYVLGHRKEYVEAFRQRFLHGANGLLDTLDMPDSLIYYTQYSHRPVFGGGGILPDVLVPMDTSRMPRSVLALLRGGHLYGWAHEYQANFRANGKPSMPFEQFDEAFRWTPEMEESLRKYCIQAKADDSIMAMDSAACDVLAYRAKVLLTQELYGDSPARCVLNARSAEYLQAVALFEDWARRGLSLLQPPSSAEAERPAAREKKR